MLTASPITVDFCPNTQIHVALRSLTVAVVRWLPVAACILNMFSKLSTIVSHFEVMWSCVDELA
jgi:hypothetical protein